jgi:hypothetical protein
MVPVAERDYRDEESTVMVETTMVAEKHREKEDGEGDDKEEIKEREVVTTDNCSLEGVDIEDGGRGGHSGCRDGGDADPNKSRIALGTVGAAQVKLVLPSVADVEQSTSTDTRDGAVGGSLDSVSSVSFDDERDAQP